MRRLFRAVRRLTGCRLPPYAPVRRRVHVSAGQPQGKEPWEAAVPVRSLSAAFVAENAGGAATDGHNRILDITPTTLHERVPLFIGSRKDVEAINAIYKK